MRCHVLLVFNQWTKRLCEMFMRRATQTRFTRSDDPPALKNGSGIPMTGQIPAHMARLVKIWVKNIAVIPVAIIVPK